MVVSLALLVLAVASPVVAEPPATVARVGTEVVTAAQVADRVASTQQAGGNPRPQEVVEDLVNEILMADEGTRLGLARDPSVVARAGAERRRLAVQLLLEKEVDSSATFDAAAVEDLYHQTADSVHLEGVMFPTIEAAEASLRRLVNGGRLGDEARVSLDPAAEANHGDLGTQTRGQLEPALAKTAFEATVGTFTGPVRLSHGWAVIRVIDRQLGDAAGMASKQDVLRSIAARQARTEARVQYLQRLVKAAGASIDERFLESTGAGADAASDQASHVVATAGATKIRYGEVVAELRRGDAKDADRGSGVAAKKEIAWSLLDDALLQDTAARKGFTKDTSLAAPLRAFERDEIVRAFSAKLRSGVPTPSDADVQSFFDSHTADFAVPAHRSCGHVVVATRESAEALRQRINAGETFEAIARSESVDQKSASKGGVLGELADEQIAAFIAAGEGDLAAAFRDTKAGEVSSPVHSHGGWHLVRCGPREEARTLPLSAVRSAVVTRLTNERGADLVRQRIAELRAKARIVVDADAVARVMPPATQGI